MGALDFAGGTVVHISSGVAALVAALVLGPRVRRESDRFEPHDVRLTVIGAGLLWFGWFGFNGGSALGGERPGRKRVGRHQHSGRYGGPHLADD